MNQKIILRALIVSVLFMSATTIRAIEKPFAQNQPRIQNQATLLTPVNAETNAPKVPAVGPVSAVPSATPVSAPLPSYPVKLLIVKAQVNAKIVNIGVTSKGNLDVPPNYVDVGWYEYGPHPGDQGSVVLDGHVDNGAEIPGVFKHLRDLRTGDDIVITMSDGKVLHYQVQNTAVYQTNQFPGDMVFNQNDQKYLKIITCHGTFVPSLGTYDHRLIVTAVLSPIVTAVLSP